MKLGTLVYIRWVDSTREGGWVDVSDMVPGIDVCESVGWLTRDEKDFVSVAGSRSPMTNGFCGVITIPRCAIRSLRKISKV